MQQSLRNAGTCASEIAHALGGTLGPTRRIFKELGLETSNRKSLKIGVRYSVLVVLDEEPLKLMSGNNHALSRSLVQCDCGKAKVVWNHVLRVSFQHNSSEQGVYQIASSD
jgi:hypothetical protein